MTAFLHVRAETRTNCTGVVETPAVSMVVAEMPSVQNRLIATSKKDTLEVVGLILARPFYTTLGKETLEVVVSILAILF